MPYKGGGPAVIDLIAGHVMVAFIGMPTTMAHAKTGKVRLVAVTDSKRPSTEPGLPTIARGGVPGYRLDNWIGRFAPASTPAEIITRLNSEIVKALQQPDVRDKLVTQGFEVWASTPEEFQSLLARDIEKFSQVVKQANIRSN